MTVLAYTPDGVGHIRDPSIPAEDEACNVAAVALADEASSVNEDGTQKRNEDLQQQNWREDIRIPEQFNSPVKIS